jgi:hypothetical protein
MAMQRGNRHGRRYGGLKPLILAIVLSAGELHASGPQKQLSQQHSPEQTLRVDVNLVTVGVSVTDRKSRTSQSDSQPSPSFAKAGIQPRVGKAFAGVDVVSLE